MNLAYMPPPMWTFTTNRRHGRHTKRAGSLIGRSALSHHLKYPNSFHSTVLIASTPLPAPQTPRPASDTPRWLSKFPVESNSNYILWALNQ